MRKRIQTATIHNLPAREFREVIRRLREMDEADMRLARVLNEVADELDPPPTTPKRESKAPATAA